MIKETIRIVTDILTDDEHGVNAKLAALPLDVGEVIPVDIGTVVEETTNNYVAFGRLPEGVTYPVLCVSLYSSPDYDAELMNEEGQAEVELLIRYGSTSTNPAESIQDVYNTIRALCQSIRMLNANTTADSRTRNNVQLLRVTRLRQTVTFAPIEDATVTAGIIATAVVRDLTT